LAELRHRYSASENIELAETQQRPSSFARLCELFAAGTREAQPGRQVWVVVARFAGWSSLQSSFVRLSALVADWLETRQAGPLEAHLETMNFFSAELSAPVADDRPEAQQDASHSAQAQ